MISDGIDHLSALKASLELMVGENAEIHEFFRDLLGRISELETAESGERHEKFKDLVRMGAFRFNGVDIRHFAHAQLRGPLPPPLFLSRTLRRLRNTLSLVNEFEQRQLFDQAGELRQYIETLSAEPVDAGTPQDVRAFRGKVSSLRETPLFRSYEQTKVAFIRKDAGLRTEAEYLAAKESVEEGEELIRARGDALEGLKQSLEQGTISLDEAQARLDDLTSPAEPETGTPPASEATDQGE